MSELAKVGGSSLLSKENFEHAYRIASMMAKSEMVPKNYREKPQDILIAMEMGQSLGLSPLSAIQNIAVINGKPCLWGDAVLAVCSGHPEFEDITENELLDGQGVTAGYVCTVKRKGRTPVTKQFTVEDAKKAGLWGKSGPWAQYPSRMLQMRARGFALRDSFADALGGIRMVEEVSDYSKENTKENKKDFMDKVRKAKENIVQGEIVNGENENDQQRENND